jgi:hypothetical protein
MYETPVLRTPDQLYEEPLLLDLAEISADVEVGDCNGCGTGGCTPKPENIDAG